MNEELVIDMIVDAILEAIEASEMDTVEKYDVVPQIELQVAGPVNIDGVELDAEMTEQICRKVSDGLWAMKHPTLLH